MDLTVREAARLLGVSDTSVYRWIRSGILPAHRVHDHYRLNRVSLQEWAASQSLSVSPRLFARGKTAGAASSLSEALHRGGISYQIPGSNRDDALDAVSRVSTIPPTVDRRLLGRLLAGREPAGWTSAGQGIAIPHPRDPLVLRVEAPLLFLCFLEQAVDFNMHGGGLVRALFFLLSPDVRSHLELLSRLAFSLHDAQLKGLVRQAAPQERILERLRVLESQSPAAPAENNPASANP
jgi:PTS system nitrogen regulatory IIA component